MDTMRLAKPWPTREDVQALTERLDRMIKTQEATNATIAAATAPAPTGL